MPRKKKSNDITQTGALRYSDLRTLNALNQLTGNTLIPATQEDIEQFELEHGYPGKTVGIRNAISNSVQLEDELESSPIAQNSGGRDFWGNSFFDPKIVVGNIEGNELSDLRAENQPWYSKLANGIGKGVLTAVTTAAEVVGLAYGLGQGTYNAITNDKEKTGVGAGGAFLSGLWNNPITIGLQAFNEGFEELLPNYYTEDERENPFALRNIFSANFLGNDIIKNLGFMVGAFYGGAPIAKLASKAGYAYIPSTTKAFGRFGKIGESAVKGARAEYEAMRNGMAAGLREVRAAAAGDADALESLLKARHLTEAERGERLRQGLENINEIANATRATTQVIGSLSSAVSEGAIEAINGAHDWGKMATLEENEDYQQKLAKIDEKYGGVETPEAIEEKIKAAEYHQAKLEEIEKGKATVGNAILLMNIPVLTYSNALQLGKLYTRGFSSNRRRLGSFFNRHTLKGSALEGTVESAKTRKGAILRAIANPLAEGSEEYLQGAASDAAGNVVQQSIDNYFQNGKSEESRANIGDFIEGFAKSIVSNTSKPEAWKEFMVGTLSAILGMPVFGSHTRDAYMKLGPVGFAGGFKGAYDEYMNARKRETNIANYINDRVKNDPSFSKLYDYLRKSEDYETALITALKNNDKEEYMNLHAEKFFEDINAFASAGHLEEFKQLIDYNKEYDADELRDIVTNTRRPITAEQQKQNDLDRLTEIDNKLKKLEGIPFPSELEERIDAVGDELIDTKSKLSEYRKLRRKANDYASREVLNTQISELEEREATLKNEYDDLVSQKNKVQGDYEQQIELKDEKAALEEKIKGDYQDIDAGEFVQMVNGNPIGMDLIPDVDEYGDPIEGTEGNEMRRILEKNRKKLLKGINDYLRIRDNIDVETNGMLDDDKIALLTKMKMMILDRDTRSLEMAEELVEGLKPIDEVVGKAKEQIDKDLEKARDTHTVALRTLQEAKANKDVSPSDIAELEKELVTAEKKLKNAEKGAHDSRAALAVLDMMTNSVRTTRAERRGLNKGYGEDQFGDTYSDNYDASKRNITSEEAQNILMHPDNLKTLLDVIRMQENLSEADKQKYTDIVVSLSSLAFQKAKYNEELRKAIKDPSLLTEAIQNSQVKMTQKEIDNKSDELALRLRRAKNMFELDNILRGSQISRDVVDMALQKAKQDGDGDFKNFITDYEKVRSFYSALIDKVEGNPAWLQEELINDASLAWNEALLDDSDTSKYDKFIEILNSYADDIDKNGNKAQAKALRNAVKELQDAVNDTTTNNSSNVRKPSKENDASKDTDGGSPGKGGSSRGSSAPIKVEKVKAQIDKAIGTAIIKNVEITSVEDLQKVPGSYSATYELVKKYNEQNPDNRINDEYIQSRVEALTDEFLEDEEGSNDTGETLVEKDYANQKSSQMKDHLRITFNGSGITEFRIYAGEKHKVLAESKEELTLSPEMQAVHKILKDSGAFDFLSRNYLGYLKQSLRPGDAINVKFLKSKDENARNVIFVAIDWNNSVARAIKRIGFGEDSKVTIQDNHIEAIDTNGNKSNFQIIGNLSVLSEEEGLDPGISRAFKDVFDAINEEVNPILDDENKNQGAQWVVSSHGSEIEEVYTGRLVKKNTGQDDVDVKAGLHELVSQSTEWSGTRDFTFGVVTGDNISYIGDEEKIEKPNPVWASKNRGAILLFVPKADGHLYPIRCTRRTVAEWFDDADGEALLNGVLNETTSNEFLENVISSLKNLMNPDSSFGSRVKGKMDLRKYFVLGSGAKKVSIHFEGNIVKIGFGDAAHRQHTITVDNKNINDAIKEFFDILRKEDIPFSIPLPSQETISGRDIISSGIFKIGLKDFYNFNPSFTIRPVDRNNFVEPEIPKEERQHFAAGNNNRPNSYKMDLGDGLHLYHYDSTSQTCYKSKVDKSGNPIGTVLRVTDPLELIIISTLNDIYQGNEDKYKAIGMLLSRTDSLQGDEKKTLRDEYKKVLEDDWSKVYIIQTGVDGVWYFDNRSSSHTIPKIFKQGTDGANAIEQEFKEAVSKKESEVITKLMTGPLMIGTDYDNSPDNGNKPSAQSYINRMNAAKTEKDNDAIFKEALDAGISESEITEAHSRNADRISAEKKGRGEEGSQNGNKGSSGPKILEGKTLKDLKSSDVPVLNTLNNKKYQESLGEKLVDTIFKDLQEMESLGLPITGKDVLDKIIEISKIKKPKQRSTAWQDFVDKKVCNM